jgi:arsenate reductase
MKPGAVCLGVLTGGFIYNHTILTSSCAAASPAAAPIASKPWPGHVKGDCLLSEDPLVNVVVYHNPECGTSCNVVSFIKDAGYTPVVIEYLTEGWTRAQLLGLFAAAGLTPRTALRDTKSPAKEMGLLEDGVTEEALLTAMLAHPILVNRPIVCTHKGKRYLK